MDPNPNPLTIIPILLLLTLTLASPSPSPSDLLSELETLRSSSDSGVIHLDDRSVARFITSAPTPRPYALLVFFDAAQLRSKPDLHLPELRSEFALLSHSFHTRHPSPDAPLFFADLEFGESQSSFSLFGVSSLPHLRFIAPDVASLRNSVAMDQSGFARLAESMAEFVESSTGLPVGPILRPPPISAKQIGFLLLTLLVSAPFVIKRVLRGDTLVHDVRLWMGLSVFVYFFSVSGTMHNIIRKMPMVLPDRNSPGRLVFFYQGSGMQLGAEGFAVGFLYTTVGLLLATVTHVLVRVRNRTVQNTVMAVAMVVGFWAVAKVIYLDNWKTGYSIHAFWPNRWK
ncbi:putative dolichyl-diphosphooligosaccharide--protein glycosyltransferase subunit 3B [Iris pallida]|uniref:Dolichyl-diphosphooligosaccharide--protein glycosyltransferase subunit 3B n=1 Tax=Iris pallida TaxID=29817 RepID=A0AAX6FTF5_IRIPA|nr:putative dolichyl-diphosphooligosaccharide--protein glycosyltransferase subunit 3B [Iris pallida]